ncbi:MAG TPA: hypothetical protein PK156_05860 [Polyangium sp.]|nr:hypothetical protein [Polyangium sp.]
MAPRKMFGYRGAGKLPTTRWSMVILAGQDAPDARKKALSELCTTYWTPVYEFIRAMGRRPDEARDLTQGFFTTRLLEKNDVAAADPARGKFRSWLLTAVKSYLANDLERARRKKRDPGTEIISIDTSEVEGRCPVQIGHDTTPERVYERRWAMILLAQALERLEKSYVKRGEGLLFQKIKPLLVDVGVERHRAIAGELNMREETFNVAVFRCRSRFQEQIRAEIAETVSHENEIEDELRYLYSGLQSK